MLYLIGPKLLNIINDHFDILIILLHDNAHNLRGDLVIKDVRFVITNKLQE